jgi:Spy/CpxP family protein refolding chaperone
MARNRLLRVTLVLLLFSAGSAAWPAQPQHPPGPGAPTPQEIEDLRETVHILMISRLKRELQLNDEQQQRIVPLIDELEQARGRYRQESRRRLEEIRRLLASGNAPERELGEQVRGTTELRRGFEAERVRVESEMTRILSPVQQARLLVFLQDFRRDMRARLEGARGRPGRPRPGVPRPRPGREPVPDEGPDDEDL